MSKIFIRLADTSGTFYIPTQGISVNRTQIKEVEHDTFVANAILNKGVIELTDKEVEQYKKSIEPAIDPAAKAAEAEAEALAAAEKAEKAKAAEAEAKAKKVEAATALYNKGVEVGKVTVLADGKVTIGKASFDNAEKAIEEIALEKTLFNALKKEVEK